MQSRREILKQLLGLAFSGIVKPMTSISETTAFVLTDELRDNAAANIQLLWYDLATIDDNFNFIPYLLNRKPKTIPPETVYTLQWLTRNPMVEVIDNVIDRKKYIAELNLPPETLKDIIAKELDWQKYVERNDKIKKTDIVSKLIDESIYASDENLEARFTKFRTRCSAIQDLAIRFCKMNNLMPGEDLDYPEDDVEISNHLDIYTFPDLASAAKALKIGKLPENIFILVNDRTYSGEAPKNWVERVSPLIPQQSETQAQAIVTR